MTIYSATYDPADNKLRLRSSTRLDSDTYARVRAAGFIWAPKQDLFVAPMWTPGREDLLIELAGEIGDEDTSLIDRASERAERFEGYQGKRAADAEQARQVVSTLADGMPLGQPILIGHHSQRRAEKDAQRIESGMRRAVNLWETSEYWQRRAAGAIALAKYKELPAVRARRIKKLEAEQRKVQRDQDRTGKLLAYWEKIHESDSLTRKDGQPTTMLERVKWLLDHEPYFFDMPRDVDSGALTPEQAQAQALDIHRKGIAERARWLAHYDNRLTYERAILAESGYTPPPKPKTKADLPLLNYSGKVAYRNRFSHEIVECEATPISKAELAKISNDYKGTVVSACGTHRLRTAMLAQFGRGHGYHIIYLTDSKQHPRPGAATVAAQAEADEAAREAMLARKTDEARERMLAREARASEREKQSAIAAPFVKIQEALKAGVQVVTAPQLFPTPPAIAARMIELAGIQEGDRVLEPSAGTGNILRAIDVPAHIVAVEINRALADALPAHLATEVIQGDFLQVTAEQIAEKADRVVMNPPFANGADIDHILHAFDFLRPGGRLVAICANGPRQAAQLRPLAESWEELPADTFRDQGTNVRTVLMTITKHESPAPFDAVEA
jgi:predicted RNA methylase